MPVKHPDQQPSFAHSEKAIDQVATTHCGLISRTQLRQLGLTEAEIQGHLHRGTIVHVQRGVYRTVGTSMSLRRDLIGACLASDGLVAASHRSALWLWGLAYLAPTPEISVNTERHPRLSGIVVHRSRDLAPHHITELRQVTVTTPARTLVDVGCVVSARVFTEALERAIHKKLVTVAELRHLIDEVAGRGRNGVGILRDVLDQRALGDARPESMLEPLMARLLAQSNIAGACYQAEINVGGRKLRPDFLFPREKVVVEVDGLSVHGTRDALDHDLERQNLLSAHGYQVLRYTITHLRQPDKTAAQILRVVHARRTPHSSNHSSEI